MKIISLNIWGGKVFDPFVEFVKKYSSEIDGFCFQESFKSLVGVAISKGTHMNIFDDIAKLLPNHKPFFGSVQDGWDNEGPVDFEVGFGQATFVRDTIVVDQAEHLIVWGEKNGAIPEVDGSVPGGMMCTSFKYKEKKHYTVCNVHGAAYPGSKLDTPERLAQSDKIKNFLASRGQDNIIVCGDFNLLPTTKSIALLEENLINLISKYDISRTRSTLSPYYGTADEQKFADYTFVSPNIEIKEFQILQDQVSDHLAMYLE